MRKTKYNWDEIQRFYDLGNTWRDIQNKFGVASQTIWKSVKAGRLVVRNKSEASKLHFKKNGGRKLSEETKKKISKSRIKYLMEHPDKVPYIINHSSKKSWPEQVFENALKSTGIDGWEFRYRNGIYEYDFAFPDKKIDVEIDGGTHKTDKVIQIDKRRDKFSKENGWKVIRFDAEQVKKDVISCINELKRFL